MAGSVLVTGWCVAHGQSPATAAALTLSSTIVAMVRSCVILRELLMCALGKS
jgi:hypothetical protein